MAKLSTAKLVTDTVASGLGNRLNGNALLNNLIPYNTEISVNGNEIASNKTQGRNIKTSYNQTDAEKAISDYAQKNLLNGLENINVFSPDILNDIKNQITNYTQQGINTINNAYEPMYRELKSDIASRFGNLDNSVFLDNLNNLEKNKTNAIETLTQNILAKQSELYESEMNNRYNYLNLLLNINQNSNSNILNFLRLALSANNG